MQPSLAIRRLGVIVALIAAVFVPELGQRVLAADSPHHTDHLPVPQIGLEGSALYLPLVQFQIPTQPTPGIAPYPDAPLCSGHDARTYHSLWDSVRGCHYDHHHGDDPHSVDDVFGQAYYLWAGGSISNPWQTFSAATGCAENDCKHIGYVWLVRRDQPCQSQYTDGCVTDFRALVHAMSHTNDTIVRYHSAWLEARVCGLAAPDVCGIFRGGGWQDSGDLLVDQAVVIDVPNSGNSRKLHSESVGNPHFGTWYFHSPGGEEQGGGMWAVIPELGDMWTYTHPHDPAAVDYFCADPNADCAWNGSRYQAHLIGVQLPFRFLSTLDVDGDGIATYHGYTDRWGMPVSGCTQIGLDCVPLSLEGVPTAYEYQGRFGYREYDIFFNNRTSGWIKFPY